MTFVQLLIAAATVEAIWETLKMVWDNGKFNLDRTGTIVLGILVCVAAGVDLFELIGLPFSITGLGMVLSGLLISRGSNAVHDFLAGLDKMRG